MGWEGQVVHSGGGSYEASIAHNIAKAAQIFLEENPGKQISGMDQLLNKYVFLPPFDPDRDWLPLEQMYAFVKPGSGVVPGDEGGQVLAVGTLSLTPRELFGRKTAEASTDLPGRFIIWKLSGTDTLSKWYPDSELRKFLKPGVLEAITLPKPKMPRARRGFGVMGWTASAGLVVIGMFITFATIRAVRNLNKRKG